MEAISYVLQYSEDADEWDIAMFEVIRDYVQPKSTTSLPQALDRIRAGLPAWPESARGRLPGALDTFALNAMAFDLARQTPYNHPNMHKLADLVVAVIDNIDAPAYPTGNIYVYPALLFDEIMGEWAERYESTELVRVSALDSEVVSRTAAHEANKRIPWTIFWHAFDCNETQFDRETMIMASAVWICYNGPELYKKALSSVCRASKAATGKPYHRRSWTNFFNDLLLTARDWVNGNDRRYMRREVTPRRWSKWKKALLNISRGQGHFSEQCQGLAAGTARLMEAVEVGARLLISETSNTASFDEKKPLLM